MNTFSNWFKDFIRNYDFKSLQQVEDKSDYFNGITACINDDELHYWDLHIAALQSINIEQLDRNIRWLDVGVWFGVMPFILKNYGFTNIETTDCAAHRIGLDERFNYLWNHFGLTPRELHIKPKQRFDLGATYDLITIMKTNMFWKTEEVIQYHDNQLSIAWQNQGADGKTHTYFTVYNKEDWEFFVDNIKEFLNPGGIAIVNPEPWPYDVIESYKSTADYLKQFQTDNLPVDQIHSNYIIIRK